MSISLDALERRIDQLLSVVNGLRAENATLRERVSGLDAERQALTQKIDTAATRLEAIMEQLPAE